MSLGDCELDLLHSLALVEDCLTNLGHLAQEPKQERNH